MFGLFRQISVPQLRASWGRTSLVVCGVATGVALIVAMQLINASVRASFAAAIDQIAGPAVLEVTLGVGEVGFDETTVEAVRRDPGVVAAVPLVRGTIAFGSQPTETVQLFGADLTAEEDVDRYRLRSTTGRRELVRVMEDAHSILLTTKVAEAQQVAVGERVAFLTPDGVRDLTVRGLLESEGLAAAFAGQLAVMDLPAAQLLLGKVGRVDQIDVMLKDGVTSEEVKGRLETVLPPVLTVARPAQRSQRYDGVLASFQAMLMGLSALGLVAGMFIIYSTTSTAAIERSAVMAQLRLVGIERGRLFGLLMAEALLLGVLGGIFGILVGIPLAWLLTGTITESMGVIFQLRFPVDRLVVHPTALAGIAVLGVIVGLFACYFSARRMAGLHPLSALRASELAASDSVRSGRLLLWWAVLLATSVGAFAAEHHWKSIAWGNFGSTLWNASVIVIAIPIVRALAGGLSRLLTWAFGAEGEVAGGSLSRATARTGVTVSAIALILTIAIMLSSLVLSCRESLRSYFSGLLAADLTVSAVSTEGGWLETPLPERIVTEIARVDGVARVDAGRVISGQPFRGNRIGILGFDSGVFDAKRAPDGWYHEGDPASAEQPLKAGTGVAISTSLADRFNLHLGDPVELASPTGMLTLPVVGVVPDYISDRGSVILNRRLLTERWGETTVSRINVTLATGADIAAVRARILGQLADRYRVKVLPLRELVAYHTDMIDRAFAVMNSVQLLIIIVTIAGVFDLLVSRITERRRELAVWRVLGADKRAVRRSVIIESMTIGALGAVLGVQVGLVTAWVWIAVHFRQLLGYYIESHFAVGAAAWYVALVLIVTAGAGYAAAVTATKRPILEGIQVE